MEELAQKIEELERRIAALEAAAHSGHTIDDSTLDTISTNVFGRINEQLRGFFGKRKMAEPATTPEVAPSPETGPGQTGKR